jgi:hypothetical protein
MIGGDGLREGDREVLLLVLLPGCRLSEGGAVRTAGVLGDGSPDFFLEMWRQRRGGPDERLPEARPRVK